MIVLLVALSLLCWAALLPMLRDDRARLYPIFAPETAYLTVPDSTFDPRGFV